MNEESNSGVCIAKGKRKTFLETYETDLTEGPFFRPFPVVIVVCCCDLQNKLERCTLMFEGRVNV